MAMRLLECPLRHPAERGRRRRGGLRAMPAVVPVVEEGLGNSSYLVDLDDGRVLVLDPGRDPAPYLAEAERRRSSVAYSVETHLHADFISGSRELAEHGAQVVAPAAAHLE